MAVSEASQAQVLTSDSGLQLCFPQTFQEMPKENSLLSQNVAKLPSLKRQDEEVKGSVLGLLEELVGQPRPQIRRDSVRGSVL